MLMSGCSVPIERLTRSNLLQGHNNQPVRIEQLIRIKVPSRHFVRIRASALGRSQPSQDLLIREGHPLLLGGRETFPEVLLDTAGVEKIRLDRPVYVYTLVTEQKQYINIQGLMVSTWASHAWAHECNTKFLLFDSY